MPPRRLDPRLLAILLGCLALAGCTAEVEAPPDSAAAALHRHSLRLVGLHARPASPQAGDWLAEHEEPGQTFAEFLAAAPVLASGGRRRIYVVPIGSFDAARQRVLDRTTEVLASWFGLTVTVEDAVPLVAIPADARRRFPHGGWLQLHTGYLMNRVLRPNLPADAACRIGFVGADLWPGEGWNFVFGQASLRHRIGVWSLYRNGDPGASASAFRLCLLRTVKTATHEIGHMFGMRHCTARPGPATSRAPTISRSRIGSLGGCAPSACRRCCGRPESRRRRGSMNWRRSPPGRGWTRRRNGSRVRRRPGAWCDERAPAVSASGGVAYFGIAAWVPSTNTSSQAQIRASTSRPRFRASVGSE